MLAYTIRRLFLALVTVLLVSLLVFSIIRFIPGTIVDAIVAQQMVLGAAGSMDIVAAREQVEARVGLDRPFLEQYTRWLGNIVLRGDLGTSFFTNKSVLREITKRLPATLELSLLGLVFSQIIALPIGIVSALRQKTWLDYLGRSIAIFCIAVPGFWIATMVIVFPSIWWGYMPPIRYRGLFEDPVTNLRMFVIPGIVLGLAMGGGTMRMMRTMMLEVLRHDFIRTAYAKGLRESVVVMRHALKNALIPVVTIVGLQIPILFGGTVIIENIFLIPGMGRLMLSSISSRDYMIVSGVMLIYSVGLVLSNLLVDLTYARLDPRIQYN